jgi:hypothetical protein
MSDWTEDEEAAIGMMAECLRARGFIRRGVASAGSTDRVVTAAEIAALPADRRMCWESMAAAVAAAGRLEDEARRRVDAETVARSREGPEE